jgi:hypothetical protein
MIGFYSSCLVSHNHTIISLSHIISDVICNMMNPKYDMELCTLMDKSYFNIFINLHEMNFHGVGFPFGLLKKLV